MSQEELNKIERRIYEIKDLCIIEIQNKNFKKLKIYGMELNDLKKRLKKAKKECKK